MRFTITSSGDVTKFIFSMCRVWGFSVLMLCTFAALPLLSGCTQSGGDAVADADTDTDADTDVESPSDAGQADKPEVDTAEPESNEPAPELNIKVTSKTSSSGNEVAPEFPKNLAIGDKAPQIYLSDFYTGDEIDKLEKGNVYVIEFWATWCPPCRASMPHLAKLQEEYGDKVTIIGITKEGQQEVGPFLAMEAEGQNGKTWKEIVNYRLVRDKKEWTNESYMTPSGQGGIPSAFIVGKEGVVEWIGHPLGMDSTLAKVVEGKWDRVAGVKLIAAKEAYSTAVQGQDWDAASAAVDTIAELDSSDPNLPIMRFAVLASSEKYEECQAVVAEYLEKNDADVQRLNMFAWTVATEFPADKRDLDLALKLAQKANAMTDENAPPVLDTLARVHYERGEIDDAVAWQGKAADFGGGNYVKTLQKYEDEQDKPEIPETLAIGDQAPGLFAAQWFTGEPLEGLVAGKVNVVEFWATWCPPCRTSMPHLSKLQEEYGDDVVFVGVTREEEDVVEKFLKAPAQGVEGKTWGEVVSYRLAQDRHNWTNDSYMKAAKQRGIPSSFIIGPDGIVEWIGHPMQMDQPLKDIIAGNWDRDEAIAKAAKKAKLDAAMMAARPQMAKAQSERDWGKIVELLDEVGEQLGDDAAAIAPMKFSYLMRAESYGDAIGVAKEIVESDEADSNTLNTLSWTIATEFPKEDRDLQLALQMAEKASALEDGKSHQVIDTLARVHAELREYDKAIELQQKAVDLGGANYEKALEEYKKQKQESESESEPGTDGDDAKGAEGEAADVSEEV